MSSFKELLKKRKKLVIGLMSGTSMDGIDSSLLSIQGSGTNTDFELISYRSIPYSRELRTKLSKLKTNVSLGLISELNFLIGEEFAKASLDIISDCGFKKDKIDLIGSHGQTIYHNPPSVKKSCASTMQIGELDVIAERTGITTVGDFRTRDIAASGEGAPIVPYVDYILFGKLKGVVLAQNIGGIANVTVVTKNMDEVIAFDTGPGNLLMDKVVNFLTDGEMSCDLNGNIASSGKVDRSLLKDLLSNPFFDREPPKSTGEELFGSSMAEELCALVHKKVIYDKDLIATLSRFTVESIANSYERFIYPKWNIEEIVVSGGGVNNVFLMKSLKERLQPKKLIRSEEYGIPADAKEAMAMAILANELISFNKTNIPSVTGAKRNVPLGKIALGSIN